MMRPSATDDGRLWHLIGEPYRHTTRYNSIPANLLAFMAERAGSKKTVTIEGASHDFACKRRCGAGRTGCSGCWRRRGHRSSVTGGLRLKIDPSRFLAPLPTGVLCTLCGRGGADIQLMHCSHIDFWHRTCAEQYFEGRCRSRRPLPTDRHAFRVAVTCFGLRESLKIRGRQHDSNAACESQ